MYFLTSNEWIHKIFWKWWKNTSFVIKEDDVFDKYIEIWNKILDIKFHSLPVYDEKYLKAEVREFKDVIKTNSFGDEVPREGTHYLHSLDNYWFCYENEKN